MGIEITGKLIDVEVKKLKQKDGSVKQSANMFIKIKEKYYDGSLVDKTLKIYTKADTEILEESIGKEITIPVSYKKFKDNDPYFEYI